MPTDHVRLTRRFHREANAVEVRAVGDPRLDGDGQADAFERELAAALLAVSELDPGQTQPRRLVLDLRGLRTISCWVTTAAVRLFGSLRSAGAELVVLTTPVALDALKYAGLDRLFTIVADEDELRRKCGIDLEPDGESPFFTVDELRKIEADGLTLGDAIRAIEERLGPA